MIFPTSSEFGGPPPPTPNIPKVPTTAEQLDAMMKAAINAVPPPKVMMVRLDRVAWMEDHGWRLAGGDDECSLWSAQPGWTWMVPE